MEANIESLHKIYNSYCTGNNKFMTFENVRKLICDETGYGMNEKDLTFIYGMSKQTVPNENEMSRVYEYLTFVEFLELVGRCAH